MKLVSEFTLLQGFTSKKYLRRLKGERKLRSIILQPETTKRTIRIADNLISSVPGVEQSATQPFLAPSRNAPTHKRLFVGRSVA